MSGIYDRTAEDLGNIVELGHVNLRVPDQRLATLFYITGLGLTRDPFMMTGVVNMWANAGRSQFHLPTGEPQVLRGTIGLVVPDRGALLERLRMIAPQLAGTYFAFDETAEAVTARCPWGNRIACHAPGPRFGQMRLGLAYVAFDVPPGTAEGIARFYREIIGAPAEAEAGVTIVPSGPDQALVFRETPNAIPAPEGDHIQITLADFSGPYRRLLERGLITEESDQHQYRFADIVEPATGDALFTVEHEVRSMRHPMYGRPLVNRNPAMNNRNYVPGYEAAAWALPG